MRCSRHHCRKKNVDDDCGGAPNGKKKTKRRGFPRFWNGRGGWCVVVFAADVVLRAWKEEQTSVAVVVGIVVEVASGASDVVVPVGRVGRAARVVLFVRRCEWP